MDKHLFTIIGTVFFVVGLGMLVGCGYFYQETQKFLETAVSTQGTVKDLVLSRSGTGRDASAYYYPVVEFEDKDGKKIEFQASTGSNPPSYNVGERVLVNYNPQNPYEARINSFFSNWFAPLIFGGLGSLFTLVGGGLLLGQILGRRKKQWLLENGVRISTQLQKVTVNMQFSANGKHPYLIISQAQNPETKEIFVFESENIWFNPEQFVKKDIDVLVDPKNYRRYLMDISFLPKQG